MAAWGSDEREEVVVGLRWGMRGPQRAVAQRRAPDRELGRRRVVLQWKLDAARGARAFVTPIGDREIPRAAPSCQSGMVSHPHKAGNARVSLRSKPSTLPRASRLHIEDVKKDLALKRKHVHNCGDDASGAIMKLPK